MTGEYMGRRIDVNQIAEEIADRSPHKRTSVNWTRIYQAARAGAQQAVDVFLSREVKNGQSS